MEEYPSGCKGVHYKCEECGFEGYNKATNNTILQIHHIDGDTIEGVVIRNAGSYPIDEFSHNVVKYVRKNHVQTDQFWAKNWRKAKITEYY